MQPPVLEFAKVTRRFGRKVALDAVDLKVGRGEVLGLVGRNGAGKTTALRLAHGMLYPDHGRISTLGLDPTTDGREVRCRVSLLCEESALYPWMTVREILDFAAALHPRWDADLALSLTRRLDLDPRPRVKALSRGNKAKVALVLAVACRPELLLLDDPTAGLDPLVRREVLEGVLESVATEGGAVVYASHLVNDVERVADRVAFLDDGAVGLEGPLDELKSRIRRARAVFDGRAPAEFELPGKIDWAADGRLLSVVAAASDVTLARELRGLGATGVEVEPLSLEEILVACLRRGGAPREQRLELLEPQEVAHV